MIDLTKLLTDYKTVSLSGTVIKIDIPSIAFTLGFFVLGIFLLFNPLGYAVWGTAALVILALWPYVHEAGHYLIAREHGLPVKEIRFGKSNECDIGGLPTHRDIMDIALTGELVNFFFVAGISVCLYFMTTNPDFTPHWLVITAFIFPGIWILSWFIPKSDMYIAVKAWGYHQNQQGGQ